MGFASCGYVDGKLAAKQDALVDCNGAAIPAGTSVATCANVDSKIAAATAGGVAPAGAAGGALTGTYPNPGLSDTAVASALAFKDCDNNTIAAGATLATCANVDSKIAAAVAAIPADKYLQGLQSYDAATNVMTLLMSDGSTVPVDMTDLVNDAVSSGATTPDATPDTAKTVRGLVNLADLQQMGDGRKVFDAGVHVGSGNPANPNRATCTAIGQDAGASNTGNNQTATGLRAGQNNTFYDQTATGVDAGFNNNGVNQTATGVEAGRNNTGGNQTATGVEAGRDNTSGNQTATGFGAGATNTGYNQTVTGVAAGTTNTGDNNSFYGAEAGTRSGTRLGAVTMTPSSASDGTVSPALPASVVGKSLPVVISGYGWRVLKFTSTTAYTTVDGPTSGTLTASVYEGLAYNNVTVLGYGAEPTASNQVKLGNGNVTEVRTAGTYYGAGFTTVSDATLKENVVDVDPAKARAFRNGLKWKRFEVFAETQSEVKETQTFERDEEYIDSEGKPATRKVSVAVQVPTGAYKVTRTSQGIQYGLIAQDVQKLAAEVGDFADVVINLGEYFELDAKGFPKKDKQGNPIKHMRLGLNYDAINVIVMAGEQAALSV